jgi:hypothetical protein
MLFQHQIHADKYQRHDVHHSSGCRLVCTAAQRSRSVWSGGTAAGPLGTPGVCVYVCVCVRACVYMCMCVCMYVFVVCIWVGVQECNMLMSVCVCVWVCVLALRYYV